MKRHPGKYAIVIEGEVPDKHAGIVRQLYQCPNMSYWLDEEICDKRQGWGYGPCPRCIVRKGGLEDPRATMESSTDASEQETA